MIQKNKKLIKISLTFALLVVFFGGSFAYADLPEGKFNVDYPAVPAPTPDGFEDAFDLNCLEGWDQSKCNSDYVFDPTLGNLIVFIFVASIWLGGIVAFISMIYAGFLYIVSGANPGMRAKAKSQLTGVIWGLAILFLTVVGLNLVNPDISRLEITGQQTFEAEEAEGPGTGEDDSYRSGCTPNQAGGVPFNKYTCVWNPNEKTCETCNRDCRAGSTTECGSLSESECKQADQNNTEFECKSETEEKQECDPNTYSCFWFEGACHESCSECAENHKQETRCGDITAQSAGGETQARDACEDITDSQCTQIETDSGTYSCSLGTDPVGTPECNTTNECKQDFKPAEDCEGYGGGPQCRQSEEEGEKDCIPCSSSTGPDSGSVSTCN